MSNPDRRIVRFAEFEFDVLAGELRRDGQTTRLEPQPARVLAVLLERPGDVVTRAELQQRVWTDKTFVDFEHGLNYCIGRIRTALGDSASEPRFLETLPRRGYRFIAPVQNGAVEEVARLQPRTASEPFATGGATAIARLTPRATAIAALLAIVVAGALAWRLLAPRATPAHDARVRIAVVPFDNETGVGEYDRLAQTLTDATVARLARDPDRLAVVGNAAILRGPRAARDLQAIGRSLDVGHVVLGQVQQIGGRLRITTHLIRVSDQGHMWAQRFEPTSADTPQLDRDVSAAVAEAVAKRLLGG